MTTTNFARMATVSARYDYRQALARQALIDALVEAEESDNTYNAAMSAYYGNSRIPQTVVTVEEKAALWGNVS